MVGKSLDPARTHISRLYFSSALEKPSLEAQPLLGWADPLCHCHGDLLVSAHMGLMYRTGTKNNIITTFKHMKLTHCSFKAHQT